jgi:glucosamine--fructose-6-phosphate aminotransferase (isomerizing)
VGKVKNLRDTLPALEAAPIGMAHTRWAVMGAATEANAHPQFDGETAVVHNGIIENVGELKSMLPDIIWESQTDTEVVVHLVSSFVRKERDLLAAIKSTVQLLKGTFALVILHKDFPDMLVATKRINPLSVGKSNTGDLFVTSDIAVIPVEQYIDLEDDDVCVMRKRVGEGDFFAEFYTFRHNKLEKIEKTWKDANQTATVTSIGDYKNFTIKEIHEQPNVIQKSINALNRGDYIPIAQEMMNKSAINIIACGSSFYAGLIGKYWLERFGRLLTNVEISSEFNYRYPVITKNSLTLFISQSGETLDTLKAMEVVRAEQGDFAVITNVLQSTMAKAATRHLLDLGAGPELSVVSTKAFTAQLAVLIGVVIQYLKFKDPRAADILQEDFERVPGLLSQVMGQNYHLPLIPNASSILYLGRGICYPIALEGALKLKETTYIHAEGYPGGEMKHGPIALIDARAVSVILAPHNELFNKIVSNAHEVIARGGHVVFFTDAAGNAEFTQRANSTAYVMPSSGPVSEAFVYSLGMQALAYDAAGGLGCDPDRPRNLAKSVTVE